jgi:hypothetical protein
LKGDEEIAIYRKKTAALPINSKTRLRPRISHLGTPFGPERFKTAIKTARINSSMIWDIIRVRQKGHKTCQPRQINT